MKPAEFTEVHLARVLGAYRKHVGGDTTFLRRGEAVAHVRGNDFVARNGFCLGSRYSRFSKLQFYKDFDSRELRVRFVAEASKFMSDEAEEAGRCFEEEVNRYLSEQSRQ